MPYRISNSQLLLLTLLSNGLYLYYWFWVTWRHYRDHTGSRVFPGWHTLAIGIPIYGLLHVHEHVTAYNRLMAQPGPPTTINPSLVVALMLVSTIISIIAAALSISSAYPIGLLSELGLTGIGATFIKIGYDTVNIVLGTGMLIYIQRKLNTYGESLPNVQVSSVKIGWGEYICVIIGVLDFTTAAMTIMGAA